MEVITYTVTPEEDGVCVRHILKAKLHFSTHAVARLTRAENGIRVNGVHARTVDPVHTGMWWRCGLTICARLSSFPRRETGPCPSSMRMNTC